MKHPWEEIEKEHREKILKNLADIPKRQPIGWERFDIAVGGLEYIGFSEQQPEKLVCISTQAQSVIDYKTKEVCLQNIDYDELELIAVPDVLQGEVVHIAGIGGGGLRHFCPQGDILTAVAPTYPKVQIVFQPQHKSCFVTPRDCCVIYEDYEIRAFGFSRCGNYMVVADSADLIIFERCKEA